MNEMSLDIKAVQAVSELSTTFNMDEAHILHSKIIAECASVERWLFNQISLFQKPAMMLSQKIDQMEKLLDQDENPSKLAKKMKVRLTAFKPFAQFRSEIAHSEMSWATRGSEIIILFENAAQICQPPVRKITAMSMDDLRNVRSGIAKAENELTMLDISPKPSCTSQPAKTSVTPAKAGV